MHTVVLSSIGMNLLGLSYYHGGAFEKVGHRGISHLMEHLMCKTTDDLREQLRALGIDHNAYTSDNRVVFWWTGLNTSLKEVAQTLYDRVTKQEVLWTREQFENEKKTVLQEYGDTFNDQFEGTYYNMMRRYYNYTGAIGYREDIEAFTYEDSIEFAKKFMKPDLICEVGDSFVTPSEFNVSHLPQDRLVFGDYSDKIKLEDVPKEDKTIVGLLGKVPISGELASKLDFIMSCLTGGLESPLYQEIREKRGLSYYSIGWTLKVGNQVVPFFAASTTNDNVETLAAVYNNIFSNPLDQILTRERFDICHKNLMIKKKVAEILPHSGARATVLGDPNPFEGMDNFTYEEAIQLAESFNMASMIPIQY